GLGFILNNVGGVSRLIGAITIQIFLIFNDVALILDQIFLVPTDFPLITSQVSLVVVYIATIRVKVPPVTDHVAAVLFEVLAIFHNIVAIFSQILLVLFNISAISPNVSFVALLIRLKSLQTRRGTRICGCHQAEQREKYKGQHQVEILLNRFSYRRMACVRYSSLNSVYC